MPEFEIKVADVDTANPVYFVLINVAGEIADSTVEQFVAIADADYPDYAIAMAQLGSDTNIYVGDVPAWVSTPGYYSWLAYEQLGGSAAVSDDILAAGSFYWNGAVIEAAPPDAGVNLFTLAEYKLYKGITDTDSTRDTALRFLITAVTNAVSRYTNRSMVPIQHDEVYYGLGRSYLHVVNSPVTSITSITFDYDSADPVTVAGAEFNTDVAEYGTITFKANSTEARRFTGKCRVIYNAGHNPVPADVRLAGMLWLDMLYDNSIIDSSLKGETLGDYKYELRDMSSYDMPAFLQHLLRSYRAIPAL